MTEIDPKLREGLRALAADGLHDAPPALEQRLLAQLRTRSRARRRNLRLTVGAGLIAAGMAVMFAIRPAPAPARSGAATLVEQADDEVAINFYRLPGADDLPPMESETVVRVQMPVSSLRLIGFPVSGDRAGEAVTADVLLGQDGVARGVRFVE